MESAIKQVPVIAVYHMFCDAISVKNLKQVMKMHFVCCPNLIPDLLACSQLVASNLSQVGSDAAEGVYIKVCKGDVVVDRFKIVRKGFIAGDGGRHWMHHHVCGERPKNSVVRRFDDDVQLHDDGQ